MNTALLPYSLRSAINAQNDAAQRRDPPGLRWASAGLVQHAWHRPPVIIRIHAALGYDRLIGSLLVSGQAAEAVTTIRRAMSRFTGSGEVPLDQLTEGEWRADELLLLRELRFLERDWRSLPDRADMRRLGVSQRRYLANAQAVLTGFAQQNGTELSRAIDGLGKLDKSGFSVLAYALYAEARHSGISLAVPYQYDF